jgi:hypothetical protein
MPEVDDIVVVKGTVISIDVDEQFFTIRSNGADVTVYSAANYERLVQTEVDPSTEEHRR